MKEFVSTHARRTIRTVDKALEARASVVPCRVQNRVDVRKSLR
jgi:hypothetical protein